MTAANANPNSSQAELNFADKLKKDTIAVRLQHEQFGIRKALTKEQTKKAASPFDASADLLSASKRLIDTRDAVYRQVVNTRRRATRFWRSMTVPYPEMAIRLLRKSKVPQFNKQMNEFKNELESGVIQLQARYEELKLAAKDKLGSLYNAGDYPARIDTEFGLGWDYPNIEPPEYLKNVHPDLYEAESQRIRAQFEEAVRLTEQTLLDKLGTLVKHLCERLTGEADGKAKTFRDKSVENIKKFFDEFSEIDLGSNQEIVALVDKAKSAIGGATAAQLRDDKEIRVKIGDELGKITQTIDEMMIARPSRQIDLSGEDED